MTNPFISIIIPTFNRAHLISETLDSILNQTYQNWECLLVDDGSVDGTKTVISTYVNKDERFVFLERPLDKVKGAPTCRNLGLISAKGDYIMFFDSDDVMPVQVLKKRVQFVLDHSGFHFYVFQTLRFFGDIINTDRIWNDLSLSNNNDLKDFLNLNPVWSTLGPLWKKSFLDNHNLMFSEGVSSWQDWEFHIRALLITDNYLKSDDEAFAVLQRFHEGETINKNNTLAVTENRLELIILMISLLSKHASFKDKDIQLLLFKLFYFVMSKLPSSHFKKDKWLKVKETLYLVPKLDFWFWRNLMYFRKHSKNLFYNSFFYLFILSKRLYFNKRFAIEDYSDRTWYKIKRNEIISDNSGC